MKRALSVPAFLLGIMLGTSANAQYTFAPDTQSDWGVGVRGGVFFTIKEFGDLYQAGGGGELQLTYELQPNLQAFLSAGGMVWKIDNGEVNRRLQSSGVIGTIDLDAPLQMVPVVAGLTLIIPYGSIRPFFSLSYGVYFLKQKSAGTYRADGTTTSLSEDSQTWSQGAFGFGLGVRQRFSNRWAFEIAGEYSALVQYEKTILSGFGKPRTNVVVPAVRFLGVLAGVRYNFL